MGLGLLRGYGLKDGAVATTVAHDSHNLIVIGTSPEAMNAAAKELVRVQGGYTLVKGTEVVDTLPLNICGLMSSAPAEELIGSLDEIAAKAHAQGVLDGIDVHQPELYGAAGYSQAAHYGYGNVRYREV